MTLQLKNGNNLATRGLAAQHRAELVAALSRGENIEIDFGLTGRITPSFLDELLGKLVCEIGLDEFQQRVSLSGMTESISNLASAVMASRAKQCARHAHA